jgi:hypothetical protein
VASIILKDFRFATLFYKVSSLPQKRSLY